MINLKLNNKFGSDFEYKSKLNLNKDFMCKYKKIDNNIKRYVRSVVFQKEDDSLKIVNKFRKNKKPQEISEFQDVILLSEIDVLPELFPLEPQIYYKEYGLEVLSNDKQLSVLNLIVKNKFNKISELIGNIIVLNNFIIEEKYNEAQVLIKNIIENYGYSHLILRKIILIKELNEGVDADLDYIDKQINKYNKNGKNVIISSLHQCYDCNVDYSSLKKSIMNVSDDNDYIDSVIRNPFTYKIYEYNRDKKNSDLDYGFQSSLIDGILFLKRNRERYRYSDFNYLSKAINLLECSSFDIEDLAGFYLNKYNDRIMDVEDIFFKHSSAWYEIKGIENYRLLQDLFYDDSESTYLDFALNASELSCSIDNTIVDFDLFSLLDYHSSSHHELLNLKKIMIEGSITRSSVFNYCVHNTPDDIDFDSDKLYWIMSNTQDLSRSINYKKLRDIAKKSNNIECKIIYYLLINKKSKNERDNHQLRKFLEKMIINSFDGDIVKFIDHQSTKSKVVAEFTYETCTEDFIAKLPHIIDDTFSITNTRARLHIWMGEKNDDRSYKERARTLLIDHKINKIRNEIHDYRIYVDAVRFNDWISDEMIREFTAVLNSIENSGLTDYQDSPQLFYLIQRVYAEFCSNKIYGISSYLGRRIRHGTFKGVMFHNIVSSIESRFKYDTQFGKTSIVWGEWKERYVEIVDSIISNNLYVKSDDSPKGLIRPAIVGFDKNIITKACIQDLIYSYSVNDSSIQLNNILIEYCWRLIADDLKDINSFLKIKQTQVLDLTKSSKYPQGYSFSNEFLSELQKLVRESFSTVFEWFKRPQSVAPKAEIGLLLKAVIEEVKETYSNLQYDEKQLDSDDELIGGAYHVIYDALFVIVYNAAMHGNSDKKLDISINFSEIDNKFLISVSSSIKPNQNEQEINDKLSIPTDADFSNAQTYEGSSGIYKLYHLREYDKSFDIEEMKCENEKVKFIISYKVAHSV